MADVDERWAHPSDRNQPRGGLGRTRRDSRGSASPPGPSVLSRAMITRSAPFRGRWRRPRHPVRRGGGDRRPGHRRPRRPTRRRRGGGRAGRRDHRGGSDPRRRGAQRPAHRRVVRGPRPGPRAGRHRRRLGPTGGGALQAGRGRRRRRPARALTPVNAPIPTPTTSGSRRPSTSRCSPTTTRRRPPPACPSTCSRAAGRGHQGLLGRRPAPHPRGRRDRRRAVHRPPRPHHLAGPIGCAGAILALANVDPEGCARAWAGDGACQRELINGHRAQSLAGIAGLKRTLCALHGTSPVTRM